MSSVFGGGESLDKPVAGPLSDFDRRVAESLNNPFVQIQLLKDFKEYMVQYLALNQPPISIAQVFGFAGFTPQLVSVATEEGTTSATFTDLATVGPAITGLPRGAYVVLWGAYGLVSAAGQDAFMGVAFNSDAAANGASRTGVNSARISIMGMALTSFTANTSNSITAKYRVTGGATGTFGQRSVMAIRYDNA